MDVRFTARLFVEGDAELGQVLFFGCKDAIRHSEKLVGFSSRDILIPTRKIRPVFLARMLHPMGSVGLQHMLFGSCGLHG
jgi:hypothetical protein